MKDLQSKQAQVTAALKRIQGRIESAPMGDKEYSELNSDLAVAEKQFQEAEQNYNKSSKAQDVAKRNQGEQLSILDPASTPMTPTEPKRVIIIVAGAALGLVLGLILAGAREVKNTSLKKLKDVRAYTQLPVLGSIPLLENDLVVRRRRRVAWLAWSTACIAGAFIMTSSIVYYYNTKI